MEETLKNIAWIVQDMLYQLQKTRGLYLHTCSRVFKTREGSINLFHSSIQKLKVPLISIVHWFKKIIRQSHGILEPSQKVLASYDQCALRSDTPKLGVFNRGGTT